tara:strand:+ start:70 stop:303 length:234 start_codon:yes stop_codon:yes gene_type:complete
LEVEELEVVVLVLLLDLGLDHLVAQVVIQFFQQLRLLEVEEVENLEQIQEQVQMVVVQEDQVEVEVAIIVTLMEDSE